MNTLNVCRVGLALTAATLVGLTTSQPANALSFSLTDLTALGIPQGYVFNLNDSGQVLGSYLVGEGQEQLFLWDKNTGAINIGTPGINYDYLVVQDFNNLGQIIGYSIGGNYPSFFWDKNTGLVNLSSLVGKPNAFPSDINNLGQIAGTSFISDGKSQAFFWDKNIGTIDLGTLGGESSFANAINDLGQVVGGSQKENSELAPSNAFIWDKINGIKSLGETEYNSVAAIGINNSGQVLATADVPNSSNDKVLYWDKDSGFIDTGLVQGADNSRLYGINDLGQIFDYEAGRSYVWEKGTGSVDIGTLGGSTFISDFNNLGQLVGQSGTESASRALYWSKSTGLVDLDKILSDLGWQIDYPDAEFSIARLDINDAGQILGNGIFNGERRAFLLTPDNTKSVPEPSTALGVFSFAAFAVASKMKRQR